MGFCLMPNHFHLVLWPHEDGDLGRFMQWLLTSHVRRYHRHHHSSGHVWQGRFKAFPIQQDEHYLAVLRYVERNPLRAKLVKRAENWFWSSLHERLTGQPSELLHPGPVPLPRNWKDLVNRPQTEVELAGCAIASTAARRLAATLGPSSPPNAWTWNPPSAPAADRKSSMSPFVPLLFP